MNQHKFAFRVGVLVLLRFFPTVRSSFRRLSESCKRRGVLSAGNVARSPVQALEHALVPLMFSLVDSSDRLSASAIARAAEALAARFGAQATAVKPGVY